MVFDSKVDGRFHQKKMVLGLRTVSSFLGEYLVYRWPNFGLGNKPTDACSG
jgi:hypothetical protein